MGKATGGNVDVANSGLRSEDFSAHKLVAWATNE